MEQKAYRGKLWKVFGMEQFMRGVWEHFTAKRAWAKAVLVDAERERSRKAHKVSGHWNRPSKSTGADQEKQRHDQEKTGTKVKLLNGHSSK